MTLWPIVSDEGWLLDILNGERAADTWTRIMEATYRGEIDTWDFAWTFACWVQNGFCIHPNKNLVSNIGFGTDATHTTGSEDRLANMKTYAMSFPLSHPPFVIQDRQADSIVQRDFSITLRFPSGYGGDEGLSRKG